MVRDIKLAGFKYLKISSERSEAFDGNLKITPGINIKSIEKVKGSKQELLSIEFVFNVDYNGLGKIELLGKLYLLVDAKTLKEAIDGWENKKLDNEINMIILNVIMQKAAIKALILEEEMGLPPHIRLPKLQAGKKE